MAKTIREKQDKKRQEKLEAIQKQVEEGSLVIRKMTKKELAESKQQRRREPKKKR